VWTNTLLRCRQEPCSYFTGQYRHLDYSPCGCGRPSAWSDYADQSDCKFFCWCSICPFGTPVQRKIDISAQLGECREVSCIVDALLADPPLGGSLFALDQCLENRVHPSVLQVSQKIKT
jgi:hypothetical protein